MEKFDGREPSRFSCTPFMDHAWNGDAGLIEYNVTLARAENMNAGR